MAGVEVFQSGDGPERTTTRTDADGRFLLGGFRQGTVFLFARCEGFRFHGQLVKADESDFTIKLTRSSERPVRRMRMLPEPIPLEESRALARRLIEPYWKAAVEKGNVSAQRMALRSLAAADPARVLERLQNVKFAREAGRLLVQSEVVSVLAQTDPEEAAAVAESIADPAGGATALIEVADALPNDQRDRKLALLARAALQVKQAPVSGRRLRLMGDVAERWYELGEIANAQKLFAEGLILANQLPDKSHPGRGLFAVRLARVDLPAALAIAKDFPARSDVGRDAILHNTAFRLAGVNPAEAQRLLSQIPKVKGRSWLPPRIVWTMAAADPERARRLVEQRQQYFDDPTIYLFLALGLKSRDEQSAYEAAQIAIRGIDRLMQEGPEYAAFGGVRGIVLPIVEQIDPSLVPELFWRAVATRPPIGNPRVLREWQPAFLVQLLAWYDREVAQVLFERVRADLDNTDDRVLAADPTRTDDFLGWVLLDPRAAVARLEKVPVNPKFEQNADFTRTYLAEALGLPYEQPAQGLEWSHGNL